MPIAGSGTETLQLRGRNTPATAVDGFIAVLTDPAEDERGFSVKMLVEDGEENEHFWVNGIAFVDGVFKGTINNDPQSVRNVRIGDTVTVNKNEISDWLYLKGQKMMGNGTLAALFPHMPKEQVDEIMRQFQWE